MFRSVCPLCKGKKCRRAVHCAFCRHKLRIKGEARE